MFECYLNIIRYIIVKEYEKVIIGVRKNKDE